MWPLNRPPSLLLVTWFLSFFFLKKDIWLDLFVAQIVTTISIAYGEN